ncbi:hypothetical protein K0M31_012590 [Melipona bicolor]|uniref:Uncharacterized protein n=1 Tax=Melipona bicolor TaxID=60889 RepID=A0AA40FJJ9_9HYME|nr:hypothetical protein K0M31_012590 [Melipona bicolor]
MAKRSTTNEFLDTSSSEDELQIDLYSDMLERLTVKTTTVIVISYNQDGDEEFA